MQGSARKSKQGSSSSMKLRKPTRRRSWSASTLFGITRYPTPEMQEYLISVTQFTAQRAAHLVREGWTLLQIRFFERVKLERRIKQLEREVKGVDSSADEHVHAKLAQAKEDLQVS